VIRSRRYSRTGTRGLLLSVWSWASCSGWHARQSASVSPALIIEKKLFWFNWIKNTCLFARTLPHKDAPLAPYVSTRIPVIFFQINNYQSKSSKNVYWNSQYSLANGLKNCYSKNTFFFQEKDPSRTFEQRFSVKFCILLSRAKWALFKYMPA
jgi:hypothetical protein